MEAWAESLGGISYPLISDFWPHGATSREYGVFRDDGVSERAIFIIDKKGVIQYIDIHDFDDQPVNQIIFDTIMKMDADSAKGFMEIPDCGEAPSADIVMYCTSWCPDCKKARVWLEEHHIQFLEVNVNDYPQAGKQVRAWANGNLVTPTFNIHGQVVVDFDIPKLKLALKIED